MKTRCSKCATCAECASISTAEKENLTFLFLIRLRFEFEPVRAQLLSLTPAPTLAVAFARVQAEETRLHQPLVLAPMPVHSTSSVMAALSQETDNALSASTRSTRRPPVQCDYC